jgi:hypothetical protein
MCSKKYKLFLLHMSLPHTLLYADQDHAHIALAAS